MNISVVIPVGPYQDDQRWLGECLESVRVQTHQADEVLLIDDMANLPSIDPLPAQTWPPTHIWRSPWRLGVAAAMNFGVALAENDLVFMLCADDTLHPECLERCLETYEEEPEGARDLSYYFVGVKYLDGREADEQYLPCGAAMVTKQLWRTCGGFPPETASGAPDAALISTMMVHSGAGRIVGVSEHDRACLYNYRSHGGSDSVRRASWQGVILETRDILTREWMPPKWGRTA